MVKSSNAMLRMLPKISSEIQFFEFGYPSYGRYLREDPWLFFEAKRGPRAKKIRETLVSRSFIDFVFRSRFKICGAHKSIFLFKILKFSTHFAATFTRYLGQPHHYTPPGKNHKLPNALIARK